VEDLRANEVDVGLFVLTRSSLLQDVVDELVLERRDVTRLLLLLLLSGLARLLLVARMPRAPLMMVSSSLPMTMVSSSLPMALVVDTLGCHFWIA